MLRKLAFVVAAVSGCTLVVGTDPGHVAEDEAGASPADEAGGADAREDGPAVDAPAGDAARDAASEGDGHVCDRAACEATMKSCEGTCANAASVCLADCGGGDEKSCTDACQKKQQQCDAACLTTCNACVKGCGPNCAL